MQLSMLSELEFPLLEYPVFLGCLPEERDLPQTVQIGIRLQWAQVPPRAVESDQLSDTICYAHIAAKIAEVCQAKPYHLIEHLAGRCLQVIIQEVGPDIRTEVVVTKLHPPAPHFKGPAIFRLRSSGEM